MDEIETIPSQPFDVGRCVNDAIDVWKKNWLILTAAGLLFEALMVISLFMLTGPLAGGICMMMLRALRKEDRSVDLKDMFYVFDSNLIYKKFLPLVGLVFLTVIAILAGLVCCVVPGIWLATIWMYSTYLMVDKDLGLFAALRVSKEIVLYKGFWWNLLIFVIEMAISVVPSSVPYLGIVIGWVVTPIACLVVTSAYIQQVDEDGGLIDDLIRAERACEDLEAEQ